MKYYQDITLLPDAEANLGFLWHKTYQQIHLALVENKIAEKQSAVAVSFPGYGTKQFPLGDKLRLFSEAQAHLEKMDISKWLSRLTDYSHVKPIKIVPDGINQYARFTRKQFKSNLLKEAIRRARYKNETIEEAFLHFSHYEKKSALPYINMISLSMQGNDCPRSFKLFIVRELFDQPQLGAFNCYGLSKTATIPWF
nr:type I-F CRISPR-associated endoribonuclease Cas6/Csy4 [Nitrosomonas nitrosa]